MPEVVSPILPCPREDTHGPHRYTFSYSKIVGQPMQVGCPGRSEGFVAEVTAMVEYRNMGQPIPEGHESRMPGLPPETSYIITRLLPEIANRLITSSEQYGPRNHRALGPAGQFGEIWRKIAPLKRALWDGMDLPREGAREILFDLIGHALLTIEMLDHEVPREGDWDSVVT
jgi:hypothetical protein